ncbi:MAG TPA: DUF4166 domain-containing protein [Steroidobacteraceae bacterium]|nr:DUF4166 domain-containing protein [Steroidobacteraceae bacterium]
MTQATTFTPPQTHPLTNDGVGDTARHGVREVLGTEAWNRLPEAVRERFADTAVAASYAGAFEIVRASLLGRVFAWLGTLFGTPVAPRAALNVEAHVRVRPDANGVAWDREYRWADGARDLVRSTKVVDEHGKLIEKLPARLCMPLDTFEEGGVLHFVSRGYYFDLGIRLWLPALLSPGVTHVEHIDLGHGWFRFTMTVMHPLFGEVFFQTGRFSASEELP